MDYYRYSYNAGEGERAVQGAVLPPPPFAPRHDQCNLSCF